MIELLVWLEFEVRDLVRFHATPYGMAIEEAWSISKEEWPV